MTDVLLYYIHVMKTFTKSRFHCVNSAPQIIDFHCVVPALSGRENGRLPTYIHLRAVELVRLVAEHGQVVLVKLN